jgi:antitoxin component YwqK of YwqJK toxin-antitoxin module
MSLFEVVDPVLDLNISCELGPDEASTLATWKFSDFEKWLEVEGKRHGRCDIDNPHLQMKGTTYYWQGELHGPSEYFNLDKTRLSHSFFIEGKKWGPSLFWYASGTLAKELHYKNDLLHGLQRYFSPQGFLRTEISYEAGKANGRLCQFHDEGKLARDVVFKEGLKEGIETFWYLDGSLQIQREFRKGEPCGKSFSWYESGLLAEEIEYLEPAWQFHLRRYNSSGQLLVDGHTLEDFSYEEKKYDDQFNLISHRRCLRDIFGKVVKEESIFIKNNPTTEVSLM